MTALVVIFAFGGLLVLAAIVGLVLQLRYNARWRETTSRLAAAMQWKPVAATPSHRAYWYGGTEQGRAVAIFAAAKGTGIWVRPSEPRVGLFLRIAIQVVTPAPLGIGLTTRNYDYAVPAQLDQIFEGAGTGRLGPNARAAILDFLHRRSAPNNAPGMLRLLRRDGNLMIHDRATIAGGILSPGVLPAAHVVLVHDHPNPNVTPQEFRQLLYELAVVAYAVEQGR